jgi:dolichol-phosphate mannosyltransferase
VNIVVVMPTYNESGNIGRMIDFLVGKEFPKIKNHRMMLLVVDDKSPDGTGKIVSEKQLQFKNLYLLQGERQGLGAAYARGFRFAIDRLAADAVMEMDADFQHDPEDVKRFVAEFDRGYDYILGSRFIKGGTIPQEWGFKRKFLSVVGNLFARSTLFVWNIHDFTTGFRLARVKGYLDKINFEKVFPKSYAYKMLLLYEMLKGGAKVKEIPIKFANREKGWSKMESEDFFESLKVIALVWADRLGLR